MYFKQTKESLIFYMITFFKICFKLKAVWALRKLNKNR